MTSYNAHSKFFCIRLPDTGVEADIRSGFGAWFNLGPYVWNRLLSKYFDASRSLDWTRQQLQEYFKNYD